MTRRQFATTVTAAPAALAAATSKPVLCFFSKHLQDFGYDQIGKALHDAGFAGVDLTVRPDGHVLPARVAEDLPRAYEAIRSRGIQVPMISTGLISASDPAARPTLKTAARLGIPYFAMSHPAQGGKKAAYSSVGRHPDRSRLTSDLTYLGHSVRTARWRYTEWDGGRKGVELYDERADPGEMHNLAANSGHGRVKKQLKQLLDEHSFTAGSHG